MQLSNLALPFDLAAAPAAAPLASTNGAIALTPADQTADAFSDLLVSAEATPQPLAPAAQSAGETTPVAAPPAGSISDDEPRLISVPPRRSDVTNEQEQAAGAAAAAWFGLFGMTPPPANTAATPSETETAPESIDINEETTDAGSQAAVLASDSALTAPVADAQVAGPRAPAGSIPGKTRVAANPIKQAASPEPVATSSAAAPQARAISNKTVPEAVPTSVPAAAAESQVPAKSDSAREEIEIATAQQSVAANAATVSPVAQNTTAPEAAASRPLAPRTSTARTVSTRSEASPRSDEFQTSSPTKSFTTANREDQDPASAEAEDVSALPNETPVSDLRALPPIVRSFAPPPARVAPSAEVEASVTSVEDVIATTDASPDAKPRDGKNDPAIKNSNTLSAPATAIATTPRPEPTAKFSPPRISFDALHDSTGKSVEKNQLNADDKNVTDNTESFGINVAKPESLMPASAFPAHSSLSEVVRPTAVAALEPNAFQRGHGSPEAEVAVAARRSVESAVEVARHFATGDRRAVTLQFSVSGVDLGVRVELRGDEVHTTFRTDSTELRAALAQQWQSVTAAQGGERASRLAEPVFTSNHTANQNGADGGAAHHRESQARQQPWFAEAGVAPRALARSKTSLVAPPPAVRAPIASVPGRLHTFA